MELAVYPFFIFVALMNGFKGCRIINEGMKGKVKTSF